MEFVQAQITSNVYTPNQELETIRKAVTLEINPAISYTKSSLTSCRVVAGENDEILRFW